MKLVSGFHNGITGPECLLGDAANAFENVHTKYGSNLKLVTYPVVIEGTLTPAFWTSYCFAEGEMTRESALLLCKQKADKLVEQFNKSE